ncbi:choice-of-anchor P family protein [Streptomyces sp. B-S-A8]|uniref:Choice-of-anchor P family protein n=1 Tax=Streptomyces solicavernae TaxID=3043614 RepID=A0ABT6RTD6_9ACTN|nr:choice-of-anchor P family protein [Streptomyces sp. B-S-A8]MDI3387696.1 choice-of-anchor P family protein [Streptomyces sp. B-S-A8]
MASVKMGVAGRAALGAVFAASLVATTAGTAHAASGESSAYGVKAKLGPVTVPETVKAAYPGGPPSAYLARVAIPGVGSINAVNATATGSSTTGVTKSTARTAKAAVNLKLATVGADAIGARCDAKPGSAPKGAARIVNGTVRTALGGVALRLPVNPGPNTRLTLPAGLGSITLNEQIRNADGSLTVNALHVRVAASSPLRGDLVVASATCKAGTAEKGAITPYAVDDQGDRVGNVAFDLQQTSRRAAAPSCTGNSMGYCTFPNLSAGTYKVCVIDVPDGYSMPKPRCKDDIAVNGNHRYVRFVIPEEKGKKG